MTLERRRPSFVPTWEGPIEAWTVKFCRKHEWRTLPAHDFDDLYQECALKFIHIRDKYPMVSEVKHFMSLYMRSVCNHINDLASTRTKERQYSLSDSPLAEGSEYSDLSSTLAVDDGGMVELISKLELEDAPGLIKELIGSLLTLDEPPAMRCRHGKRETTADYLRRVSGAPAGSDLVGAAADFLGVSRNEVSAR